MAKGWHQKQKEKGVKLILTWFEARNCWKKYHEGKVKYLKHPNSAKGYEAAVAENHGWLQHQKDTRQYAPEYCEPCLRTNGGSHRRLDSEVSVTITGTGIMEFR